MFCILTACGSDSDGDPGADGSGGEPGAGVGGSAMSGGGVSGGSGKGGSAGLATGGAAGGAAAARCEGTFGASKTLFSCGDHPCASLSITEDELELFYVHALSDEDNPITVLSRPTRDAAFPASGTRVPELQAACATGDYPTIDVSNDGLRMYLTCLDGSSPLRLATRASRSATWTVAPDPIGTVADSIGVSEDELSAVAVAELATAPRPVLYQRASRNEPFGSAQDIPLITSLRNPDLVGESRFLFGVISTAGVSAADRLVVSTLTGSSPVSFSEPTTNGMPTPSGADPSSTFDYTPTVTPNCRTVYFLRRVGVEPGAPWTIEVAER